MENQLSDKYANSYALIIGVNEYEDLPPLYEAENDASKLAELLQTASFGFAVNKLLGEEATLSNVQDALHKYRDLTEQDDRILIYFACHGFTEKDNFGRETGYLALKDTKKDRPYTALKYDDVTVLRGQVHAKHILFIFDTCFSGKALGLTRLGVPQDEYRQRKAYQVIAAGDENESVADNQSFTSKFLELLSDKRADKHGLITVQHIMAGIRDHFAKHRPGEQLPITGHLGGSNGGEFILYESPKQLFSPEKVISPVYFERLARLGELLQQLASDDQNASYSARLVLNDILNYFEHGDSYRNAVQELLSYDFDYPKKDCETIDRTYRTFIDFDLLLHTYILEVWAEPYEEIAEEFGQHFFEQKAFQAELVSSTELAGAVSLTIDSLEAPMAIEEPKLDEVILLEEQKFLYLTSKFKVDTHLSVIQGNNNQSITRKCIFTAYYTVWMDCNTLKIEARADYIEPLNFKRKEK